MNKENDTIEKVCEDMNSSIIIDESGSYFFTERIRKIHKHELAAKDEEIAKRNALIKELADALDAITCHCPLNTCKRLCGEPYNKCVHIKNCALIKRAREVMVFKRWM